ncbi:MAG: chorismate mutase [Maritimibacter sp.]
MKLPPRIRPNTATSLAELRAGIDAIDAEIMQLLAERLAYADAVVPLKAAAGIAAAAPSRVQDVINKVRNKAQETGFDPEIAEPMWRVMIEAIIAREQRSLGFEGEDK